METTLLDLVRTLPPELRASVVAAFAILLIGGTGVGLIEFTYRKDLLSQTNARRLSLAIVGVAITGASALIISVVILLLLSAFGGASPI